MQSDFILIQLLHAYVILTSSRHNVIEVSEIEMRRYCLSLFAW